METAHKSVDRQATFDTDPNRARLTRGALKLPVIEGKDKDKGKGRDSSPTKATDNKTVKHSQKEIKSVTSEYKVKSNKSTDVQKEPSTANSSSKANSKRDSNESSSAPKPAEANRKSDILSSVNKKVTAPNTTNKTHTKDSQKPVEKRSEGSDTSRSDKATHSNTSKSNKTAAQNKAEQTSKTSDKTSDKTNTSIKGNSTVLKSSSPQTKVNGQKQTEKHDSVNVGKAHASHKPSVNKDTKVNESAKTTKSETDNSVKHGTPRGPEKQTAKASVLKDFNSKPHASPAKGNPQKNNNESVGNKQTSKLQESNTPRGKDSPTKKPPTSNLNKSNNDTSAVKQTKKPPDSQNKESKAAKVNNKSPPVVQNDTQPSNKRNGHVVQTKGDTVHEKTSNKLVETNKTKKDDTITVITSAKSLPINNAPTETHLSKNDHVDKNDIVSPRYKQTQDQKVKSSSPKSIPEEPKIVQEDITEIYTESELNPPEVHVNKDISSITEQETEDENKGDEIETLSSEQEPNSKRTLFSHNLKVPPAGDDVFKSAHDSTENTLTTSGENKHETYVVSPSVSKLKARSPRGNTHTIVGRLSPTNETVEPIKLDQKREKGAMDVERKESYSQVYAERNTLLKAEITYRKRIKQLEEEANGFLKAIDELTTENRYLRGRVDALEDELRGKGDVSAIDKIPELQRVKAELENKLKRLEKASNENKTSDEVRELKEQIVKLQSENHTLNEDNVKLKSENYETAKKLNALNSEKKTYSKNETSTDSDNKQTTDLNSKVKRLEKKVNSLEFENKTLSETLAQKKTELGELLGVMKDENKFDDELKALKDQVVKLTKDKKDADQAHNKEKRQLNEKIQELKALLDAKNNEGEELKIKLDEKEKENKKLKSSTETKKKLADVQSAEIAKLQDENNHLKEEKDEYKNKYTNIVSVSESAAKDLGDAKDKLEDFNKDLQKIVSDKESQISKLINQLDTMRKEREQQRQSASDEREKLKSEKEKNEDHMKNIKRLETDLKHFVVKLDESKIKENTMSTDLEERNYEVSNLEKQVFELNMKMENHSKRMNELDREKRDMEREKREWEVKKDKIDDIEASNKRLMEENRRLRNQIEMSSGGSQSDYRMSERKVEEKPVVEAWVNIKDIPTHHSQAIYVQKEKPRDRTKRVQLVQPSIQKKRQPFSKSSPVKQTGHSRHQEHKSSGQNTHRSLEDLRKVGDPRTPESEHSLPELSHESRLTYAGFGGYREIHKNRIRAAHKRVY